jgi:2-amino-4-hydroxy-6-hydroxymethyldihydropteridine diphosphokinase
LETAFLAFGSNLGDRQGTLSKARAILQRAQGIEIGKASRLYETDPLGGPPGQSPYLNSVLELRTELSPVELLSCCLKIEQQFGRERQERWGPRTLDLDILFFGKVVSASPGLTIPHPRLHERPFVLMPLADIAPEWVHPLQKKTVRQLCACLKDVSGVRCLNEEW